jgi:hypothetical protein
MTERKPPEISFVSWVDQQISEAAQRGAFDNLPGAGRPLPRRALSSEAWLQDYLRREGVSAEALLPTPLRLRKEIERLTETVQELASEQQVREVVAELNRQIVEWRRIPEGPPIFLSRVDEEAMLTLWRERRPGAGTGVPGPAGAAGSDEAIVPPGPAGRARSGRSRWWHRRPRTG